MKSKVFFSIFLLAGLFFAACKGEAGKNQNTAKTTGNPNTVYACPMHPEITGKAGDTCSKCGMDLEPVEAATDATYACPMHPEITGKAGDKCSKCGMDLVRSDKPAAKDEEDHKH